MAPSASPRSRHRIARSREHVSHEHVSGYEHVNGHEQLNGHRTTAQVPVSATLAANEVLARKRKAGETVLPMAFGEAGLPAHPPLLQALAMATNGNAYGPVAGRPALREAAAGYWSRRGLPTAADAVVSGPGSKALLFGLLLGLRADVAVPQPSWVSYAAQASMIGTRTHFVPSPPGEGGICDPDLLAQAVIKARAAGRRIGAVIMTLPDNPTGQTAQPTTVAAVAEVAAEHDLLIISDEIYRDLRYDTTPPFPSPALVAPERTVVTTALSKSLALGGWRIGVARMPDRRLGRALRERLLGIGSEIWSATAGPVQEAAALAFAEPPDVTKRIAQSRRLHAAVCHGVASRFAAAGLAVPAPQAAFYLYPDFAPWREHLAERHGVTTGPGLAGLLLDRYGMGVLPASAFGEDERALRLRVATGLLYGETGAEREQALNSPDPLRLPWISAALNRVTEILTDLRPR
ncbi:MAG TPA: pyridoxal phosphate-dependent aminotransferase [Streptosporangiaceae bacterium]